MKIKIAYQEHERDQADRTAEIVRMALAPEAVVKVVRSDKHEPFRHIYLTSKNRKKQITP